MGTTAQKLQAILNSKAAIKSAIENKGVPVGDATLAEYAGKIASIVGEEPDGMNGFLSVESKTIPTSASATTNITYNKNCGILDENYKKWDTLEWHQRWVDNGYSATGLSKPIGIWMKAFGLDLVYLWPILSVAHWDILGERSYSANTFTHWPYNNSIITSSRADTKIWPANQSGMIAHGTAGKYNSDTWRAEYNGEGIDLVCLNTLETFHIPSKNVGYTTAAFSSLNYYERTEALYQQCEFYRALFAICSGIATTQQNGTKTTVEILNANGQQAAVNEDMYFWIGGTNTGLLAKYNLESRPGDIPTTAYMGQATVDGIYTKQIGKGINMNDTGVNSQSKPVLSNGNVGAEAVAVNGYWYIKTPFISSPSTTSNNDKNMQNCPVAYACKKIGVALPTERMIYPYWLNKSTHITSIVTLLRTTEGLENDVPSILGSAWSCSLMDNTHAFYVNLVNGYIFASFTDTHYGIVPTIIPTQQYT